jgi:hypothetical protein
VQPHIAQRHRAGFERRARTDDHAATGRVLGQHVERLAAVDADPAALADGEAMLPAVAAQDGAAPIDDLARLF